MPCGKKKKSDLSEIMTFRSKKEAESYITNVQKGSKRYSVGRPNPMVLSRGEGSLPISGYSVFYAPYVKDLAWKKRRY
jgi:hypothetical protein